MIPSTAAAAPWVVDDLAPIHGPENDKDDAHSSIDEHILPGAALNGPNSHIAASLRWVNRNLRCGSDRMTSVAGNKRLVPRVQNTSGASMRATPSFGGNSADASGDAPE